MITALAELLRRVPRAAVLSDRLLRNRDVLIRRGAARGLRFNAATSTIDYALGLSEASVQDALERVLRPACVFYDIGANVGFFTVIAARLCGSKGRVLAFEPVPENAAAIRRNLRLNGFANVEVHESAVARTTGQAELRLAHYAGGAALADAPSPPDVKGSIRVATLAIDDLIETRGAPPPDVVKIDVEGAELAALEGMACTIARHRPAILYEIDAGDARAWAERAERCARWLRACGYRIEKLPDCYPGGSWVVGNFLALPQLSTSGTG